MNERSNKSSSSNKSSMPVEALKSPVIPEIWHRSHFSSNIPRQKSISHSFTSKTLPTSDLGSMLGCCLYIFPSYSKAVINSSEAFGWISFKMNLTHPFLTNWPVFLTSIGSSESIVMFRCCPFEEAEFDVDWVGGWAFEMSAAAKIKNFFIGYKDKNIRHWYSMLFDITLCIQWYSLYSLLLSVLSVFSVILCILLVPCIPCILLVPRILCYPYTPFGPGKCANAGNCNRPAQWQKCPPSHWNWAGKWKYFNWKKWQ